MRQPVVFFGHGNPMNALANNDYTRAWVPIGGALPRPRGAGDFCALVCAGDARDGAVPAHAPRFRRVSARALRRGLPRAGRSSLGGARRKAARARWRSGDAGWGLDHGTWSVFAHVFPGADMPIVQFSIDETLDRRCTSKSVRVAPLRDDGVLIVASGNVVHNLDAYAWGRHSAEPFDWAVRFEAKARELLTSRVFEPLIDYESLGEDAILSVPTPDHYLPLLYAMGASDAGDRLVSHEGIDGGSISMLSVLWD